jgi:hypothetical protein
MRAANLVHAFKVEGENKMRIICDHCDRQISGAVKVLAGTLNLHPDCMTELGKETRQTSTAMSWQGQENSAVALVERNATSPSI